MVAPQHGDMTEHIRDLVGGRRVIVASNRGPVEFQKAANGALTTKRGSGGVVTALAGLARTVPLTWVAATLSEGDRLAFPTAESPSREVRLGRQPLRVRYVNVPADTFTLHYDRVSNYMLWFLQHYMWDPAREPSFTEEDYRAWDDGYRVVNQAIGDTVASEAAARDGGLRRASRTGDGSGAIILLQDYQLYLTAGFIRARLPRATIQQFIHIPWPSVRYWQFLPERFLMEIFESLAANDVLGFQTERDARNFLEGTKELLPGTRVDLDGGRFVRRRHRLLARAYPITVDAEDVRKSLSSAQGLDAVEELAPYLNDDCQVIVRVDRLEPTKNIVRGLQAYEGLLRRHPELRGKVRHLAFLVPSREGLAEYQRYGREVRRTINRINREFGTKDWRPIIAFFENNRSRALVALRRADLVLVNPVIDGMNLVVKEAAIANERDCAVILSRTAGAYRQLADTVLTVSPLDIEDTIDQLHEGLTMPDKERHRRLASAREIVLTDTLGDWIFNQLSDAAQVRPAAAPRANAPAPAHGAALRPAG